VQSYSHLLAVIDGSAKLFDGRCLEKQAQWNVDAVAIVQP
jgi:hypothetical protein